MVLGKFTYPVLHLPVRYFGLLSALHNGLVLGEDTFPEGFKALLRELKLSGAPFLDLIPLESVDLPVLIPFAVVLEKLLDSSAVGVSLVLAVLQTLFGALLQDFQVFLVDNGLPGLLGAVRLPPLDGQLSLVERELQLIHLQLELIGRHLVSRQVERLFCSNTDLVEASRNSCPAIVRIQALHGKVILCVDFSDLCGVRDTCFESGLLQCLELRLLSFQVGILFLNFYFVVGRHCIAILPLGFGVGLLVDDLLLQFEVDFVLGIICSRAQVCQEFDLFLLIAQFRWFF